MKRALVILAFLAAFSVNAQSIKFGIKGGVGYSFVSVNETIGDVKYKTGLGKLGVNGGLFARFSAKWIYFQPELLFTSSGGTINIDSATVSSVQSLTYNKLELPLTFGFIIKKRFRFGGGLVGSMLLAADARDDVSGTVQSVKSDYQTASVGWTAGIGFDIKWLAIDLAYEDNLSQFGTQIEEVQTDLRNGQIRLSLGFHIYDSKR